MFKNLLLATAFILSTFALFAQQTVDVYVTNKHGVSQVSSDLVYVRIFKDGELHLDLVPHNTNNPISLEAGFDYILKPYVPKNCTFHNINAYDLYLLRRVIIGEIPQTGCILKSADVNANGFVNSADIISLNRYILSGGSLPFHPQVEQLGFFAADTTHNCDHTQSLEIQLEQLMTDTLIHFSYFITGDLSSDAFIRDCEEVEVRNQNNPTAYLEFENRWVEAGNEYEITGSFSLGGTDIVAAQFGFFSDNKDLQVLKITTSLSNDARYMQLNDVLGVTISANTLNMDNDFTLTFKALKSGRLSELLRLDDSYFVQEVYDPSGTYYPIEIRFLNTNTSAAPFNESLIATIYPNPITHQSIIEFQSNKDQDVLIEMYDQLGTLIAGTTTQVSSGLFHMHDLFTSMPKPGMYTILIRHSDGLTALKAMVGQ
jgi:hypothetical protein